MCIVDIIKVCSREVEHIIFDIDVSFSESKRSWCYDESAIRVGRNQNSFGKFLFTGETPTFFCHPPSWVAKKHRRSITCINFMDHTNKVDSQENDYFDIPEPQPVCNQYYTSSLLTSKCICLVCTWKLWTGNWPIRVLTVLSIHYYYISCSSSSSGVVVVV